MPRKKKTQELPAEEVVEKVDPAKEEPPADVSAPAPKVSVKNERRGRVIKYMGTSDIRRLEPGETLLFRHEPIHERLEWNGRENGHLVHTANHPDIPDTFWDRLCEFTDFQDVTEEFHDTKKQVPPSRWDQVWSPRAALWTPPRL